MLGKLIPIILALVGAGAGVGAGLVLRPEPAPMTELGENACICVEDPDAAMPPKPSEEETEPSAEDFDFVRLNNQFVVPIVSDARVSALVVMSLTLQVDLGQSATVYQIEPKLRDEFLQVMFNHANAGGFTGPFTETERMRILRNSLLARAEAVIGETVHDVLITDIVKQDT